MKAEKPLGGRTMRSAEQLRDWTGPEPLHAYGLPARCSACGQPITHASELRIRFGHAVHYWCMEDLYIALALGGLKPRPEL
jgi:hypothetical protein